MKEFEKSTQSKTVSEVTPFYSDANLDNSLGCTYVNYGQPARDLCDQSYCYGDQNCANDCCSYSNACISNSGRACIGDYYNYYEGGGGGGGDDGSNLTWLWVIIVLALLGFCGWFVYRVMKSRRKLREGGDSSVSVTV